MPNLQIVCLIEYQMEKYSPTYLRSLGEKVWNMFKNQKNPLNHKT